MHFEAVGFNEKNYNRDLILNMINLCIESGDNIMAMGNLQFGLNMYPDYHEFQNLMGYILTNEGNHEEALEWLLKVEPKISELEDDVTTIFDKIDNWICLAICYLNLKNESEALFHLNKLINYYGELKVYTIAHALYERSMIYLSNKLYTHAGEDLNQSKKILDEIKIRTDFEDPLFLFDNIQNTLKTISFKVN